MAAIPAGTIIGPVLEVHLVKVLEEYALNFSIPSICKPGDTSRCDIQRDSVLRHSQSQGRREVQ